MTTLRSRHGGQVACGTTKCYVNSPNWGAKGVKNET